MWQYACLVDGVAVVGAVEPIAIDGAVRRAAVDSAPSMGFSVLGANASATEILAAKFSQLKSQLAAKNANGTFQINTADQIGSSNSHLFQSLWVSVSVASNTLAFVFSFECRPFSCSAVDSRCAIYSTDRKRCTLVRLDCFVATMLSCSSCNWHKSLPSVDYSQPENQPKMEKQFRCYARMVLVPQCTHHWRFIFWYFIHTCLPRVWALMTQTVAAFRTTPVCWLRCWAIHTFWTSSVHWIVCFR